MLCFDGNLYAYIYIGTDKSINQMFSPTILIVIVLYKNKIANSVSYQIIKEQCNSNCKIFIYDNSPVIDSDFIKYPIVYIHDHSNGGLGKAYNSAAQYAKENGIDWLLILDQDTKLLSGFLENYIQTIKKHPEISILAPQVKLPDGTLLSPHCRKRKLKKMVSDAFYPMNVYFLINSGLCIRTSAFLQVKGYNEDVWLDFSDIQFTRKLSHSGIKKFFLLSSECIQNFSNNELDVNVLKRRFDIYIECAGKCEYFDFPDWLFRQHSILRHTMALSLRTMSCYFIKCYFTKYLFK
ncbi:glycosyltransferase [Bacteroides sp. OM08-17BH]|nr:glycosyltransferase [Bacteroides sp. OM08-17BH]HBO06466.1 hypothetical protein [Bacteroides sp.]